MKIEWSEHNTVPKRHRGQVGKAIDKWKHVIPTWVTKVVVYYKNQDNPISVSVEFQYRVMWLYVGDSYFTDTESDQADYMLHEFAHAHTTPMIDILYPQIEKLLTEEQMKVIKGFMVNHVEFATESLKEIFSKHARKTPEAPLSSFLSENDK